MHRNGITLKQHAFLVEYLRNGRRVAAAYRKAYDRPDMDVQRVLRLARNVRRNPIIAEEIARADAEAQDEINEAIAAYSLSKGRLALELAHIAFASLSKYFVVGPDGMPRVDMSRMTDEDWAVLSEITVDEYTEGQGDNLRPVKKVKFKLHDKRQAVVDLAKLMGYLVDPATGTTVNVTALPGIEVSFVRPGDISQEAPPAGEGEP